MENKDTKMIRKYLNLIESIENKLIFEKNSNIDLNEESAYVTAARGTGGLKLVASELDDVMNMMRNDASISKVLTKNKIFGRDELLSALKGNRLPAAVKGAMDLNILKSTNSSKKLIELASDNLVKSPLFKQKYKSQIQAGQPQFEAALKQAGYSENAITRIVEKANLKQTSGIQSTAKQSRQTLLSQPTLRDRLKDKSYVDGLRNKYKPKTLSTQIADKVKGMNWKQAVGYTILAGGTIAGLWFLFADSGKTDELPPQPPQEFPPCAKSLLTNKQGVTAISPKGEISILVKQTGIVAYDGIGGLRFYSNGRVFTADNSKGGTYTCKGSEVAVQEESKNLSEEDVLGMSITWDSKTTPNPGETPAPGTKSTYRNCTDFPYTFGCRSQVIKEVQVCLGMSPKYQTGNFGPITLKELKSKRGEETITKEVYDSIKQSCQTSATRPESQYIEPMPSIKSGQIQQPEIQPKTQPSQPSQPSQLNKDFCVALFKNIDDRDQESGRKTANSTEIQQIKDCLQQYNFLFSGSAKMRRRYGLTMSGGDRGIR